MENDKKIPEENGGKGGLQKPIPEIFKETKEFEENVKKEPSLPNKFRAKNLQGKTKVLFKLFPKGHKIFLNRKFISLIIVIIAISFFVNLLARYIKLEKDKEFLTQRIPELLIKQESFKIKLDEKTKELEKLKSMGKWEANPIATDAISDLREKFLELESDREDLRKEISMLKSIKSDLEEEIVRVKNSNSSLWERLKNLNRDREILIAKLKHQGISVKTDVFGAAIRKLVGRVLVVENKCNIICINLGELDGVKIGVEFDVLKNDKLYGRVKIDEVHEAVSIGKIVLNIGEGRIKENMEVRSR